MSKKEEDEGSIFLGSMQGFLVMSLVIVAIWLGNFFLMPWLFPDNSGGTGAAGTAGDMFGGVTALFSGLAFAGLITTLFMQKKELELQRRELEQTRGVFNLQRVESNFFGMLRLWNEYASTISLSERDAGVVHYQASKEALVGRNALAMIIKYLPQQYYDEKNSDRQGEDLDGNEIQREDGRILQEYSLQYERYFRNHLGPYFRMMEEITKIISSSPFLKCDEKRGYLKTVRAHLSEAELVLLLHAASHHSIFLKDDVEQYGLLCFLSEDSRRKYSSIVSRYSKDAFELD